MTFEELLDDKEVRLLLDECVKKYDIKTVFNITPEDSLLNVVIYEILASMRDQLLEQDTTRDLIISKLKEILNDI